MKADETPFYFTRVECPVCRTVNEFETIKLGAYTESGRDTDFRPLRREWRNPRYQNTNPLLYFMASCTSCFYTREFNRRFRDWKSDTAYRTHRQALVRQQHLGMLAEEDSPVKMLGAALWPASYPMQTAINKLLLGILDEEKLEGSSHFDIARWYLRVAWLFREMSGGQDSHTSPWTHLRQQIEQKLGALRTGTEQATQHINDIKNLLDCHPESAIAAPGNAEGPARCGQAIQTLLSHAGAMAAETERLLQLLLQNEGGRTVPNGGKGEERYGDFPSYTMFLQELRDQWDGAPLDETSALAASLNHYRIAYREGRDVPPGNAQIQLAYMIGELARRTGELSESRQFFDLAIRTGRDWIHKLNSEPTKTALARHIVDLAIEQIHVMREQNAV